jgi:hypothetical protein
MGKPAKFFRWIWRVDAILILVARVTAFGRCMPRPLHLVTFAADSLDDL